jgi:hypothetical protein
MKKRLRVRSYHLISLHHQSTGNKRPGLSHRHSFIRRDIHDAHEKLENTDNKGESDDENGVKYDLFQSIQFRPSKLAQALTALLEPRPRY